MEKRLERVNQGLRAVGVRVTIKQKGNRLYLRATLPHKPHSGKRGNVPTDISLGVSANDEGLKLAIAEARRLGRLLDSRTFCWKEYLGESKSDMADVLAEFEEDYFSTAPRTPERERHYRHEFHSVFQKLPAITADAMIDLALTTPPCTRNRRRYCLALAKLATFVGIDPTKIRELGKGYTRAQLNPRNIPSDEYIWQIWQELPEKFQWTYGAIATYGLRPHEVYALDWDETPLLWVNRGKTGARIVTPLHPEWLYAIGDGEPPHTICKTNCAKGERISKAIGEKIPFNLYDLRHAWAIRAVRYGLDISLAAQQMGHSVKIHSEIYHYWIDKNIHLQAWEKLTRRSDRPIPPLVFKP